MNEQPDFGALEKANQANEENQSKLVEAQKELQEIVANVWDAKETASKAETHFKELKQQLTDIMDQSGVEKIAGTKCNVSLSEKDNVQLPKEMELKKKVFDYIKKLHGEDVLYSMLTINARSFNSFIEVEKQNCIDLNESFELDDIVKSYTRLSLSIRKKTVKK